jgi:hypothetical protein
MQIDAQTALKYFEKAGGVCVFDTEATGTSGDYNSILVATLKPIGKPCRSFVVSQPGHDVKVVREFRDALSEYPMWVGYYSKGFDIPMIQARLLYHELEPLPRFHHIDLYYVLRYGVKTSRHSQAHLLEWLNCETKKLTLSPSVWNLENPTKQLATLKHRCESDCRGLENLYQKSKHLIREICR